MPMKSSSWNIPAPLPRLFASKHSARYIGTTTPMNPAATPCIARPRKNIG